MNEVVPFAKHGFSKASFEANNMFFLKILNVDPTKGAQMNKIFPRDIPGFTLPISVSDGVQVGFLYFFQMLKFCGKIHFEGLKDTVKAFLDDKEFTPIELREIAPLKSAAVVGLDDPLVFDLTKDTKKHQIFTLDACNKFPKKKKENVETIGSSSIHTGGGVSLNVLSLFMHKSVCSLKRKMKIKNKDHWVTLYTPDFLLQPYVNNRKLQEGLSLTKKAGDRQNLVRDESGSSYILDAKDDNGFSVMRTALGWDETMILVLHPIPVLPYQVNQEKVEVSSQSVLKDVVLTTAEFNQGSRNYFNVAEALPLSIESVSDLLDGLFGLEENDITFPDVLLIEGIHESHKAVYMLSVVMMLIDANFGHLSDEGSWLKFYHHLFKIVEKRVKEKVDKFEKHFGRDVNVSALSPSCVFELKHKVYYLFSLLFGSCCVGVLDGGARMTSCIHANVGCTIPFGGLEKESCFQEIENFDWDFPKPGPRFYDVKSAGSFFIQLYCPGTEEFSKNYLKDCRELSKVFQCQNLARGSTFREWLDGTVDEIYINLHQKEEVSRLEHGLKRFFPEYEFTREEDPDFLSSDRLPSLQDVGEIIFSSKGNKFTMDESERKAIHSVCDAGKLILKLKRTRLPDKLDIHTSPNCTMLRRGPMPFEFIGSTGHHWDKRTHQGDPLLPYLQDYEWVDPFCPGFCLDEIASWYYNMLQVLIAKLFTVESTFFLQAQFTEINHVLKVDQKKFPESLPWIMSVVYNNHVTLSFMIQNGFVKEKIQLYHFRQLFKLIVLCLAKPNAMTDQMRSIRNQVDPFFDFLTSNAQNVLSVFQSFISSGGVGKYVPVFDGLSVIDKNLNVFHSLKKSIHTLPRLGHSDIPFTVSETL